MTIAASAAFIASGRSSHIWESALRICSFLGIVVSNMVSTAELLFLPCAALRSCDLVVVGSIPPASKYGNNVRTPISQSCELPRILLVGKGFNLLREVLRHLDSGRNGWCSLSTVTGDSALLSSSTDVLSLPRGRERNRSK